MIIAIDPSLRALGLAVLDPSTSQLWAWQIERPTTSDPFYKRALYMTKVVDDVLGDHFAEHPCDLDARTLVMEIPANYKGAAGLQATDSEAIQKLYGTVGSLLQGALYNAWAARGWGVEPFHWKGQVPKSIMISRATQLASSFGVTLPVGTPSDVCEAILLADFARQHVRDRERLAAPFVPILPLGVGVTYITSFSKEIA